MQSFSKSLITLLAVFTVGVGILTGASLLVQQFGNHNAPPSVPIVKNIVLKPPTCDLSFDNYQKLQLTQAVSLVENFNSYAVRGKFFNGRSLTLLRSGISELACGYLFIKVRVDGHGLDDRFDSVYINPQGLGGHVLGSTGLVKNISNETSILLPLNSIAYLPSGPYNPNSKDYKITDWVKLLNSTQTTDFIVALSTSDRRGVIEEINLAYKCWNPDTGLETTDCKLGLAPR